MKILHIQYQPFGGAGVAAVRLHCALTIASENSSVLFARDAMGDNSRNAFGFCALSLNRATNRLLSCFSKQSPRSLNFAPTALNRLINKSECDIVHLHWIHAEMISIAEIAKIEKPVVWTLHDMWAFSGAEHYPADRRYVTGYGRAEDRGQKSEGRDQMRGSGCEARPSHLGEAVAGCEMRSPSKPPGRRCGGMRDVADVEQYGWRARFADMIDRWVFKRKEKHWKDWNPYIVTPSRWLADCVRESHLFKDLPVETIPNCLDTTIFAPREVAPVRQRFGLPEDKLLVLFGSFNPMDKRKGGDLLGKIFERMDDRKHPNLELVVFGADCGNDIGGFPTRWLGSFSRETDLADLYNAVDLFVAPSRQDNLPNTVAESLSCGTPVVAFDIGGMPDMIKHQKNGWLARPFDIDDFARGMEWVLNLRDQETAAGGNRLGEIRETNSDTGVACTYAELSRNAREVAADMFSQRKVAGMYLNLYRSILEKE